LLVQCSVSVVIVGCRLHCFFAYKPPGLEKRANQDDGNFEDEAITLNTQQGTNV